MVNRYPGSCAVCSAHVPAKGGTLRKIDGVWYPVHLACEKGEPGVISIVIGDQSFTQNRRGRCEDAPCCGCCTI